MKRTISKTSQLVLSMPSSMTNREVADLLNMDLDNVKNIRRAHKVVYNKTPRDRGYRAKIVAKGLGANPKQVADEVGCSKNYVLAVRRQMGGMQ